MAVTENRRMQQLRGKYADLDKSKMLVGEIAVPSDHSPIFKVDTDKYIELVSSEDTEYIEKITEDLNNALSDVQQLAIDKVGINNSVESDLQTYSSRKIQTMHNEQAQEIANQLKIASGTEIIATDTSKGYVTSIEVEGKSEQNGTPTPSTPIAIESVGEYDESSGKYVLQVKSVGLSTDKESISRILLGEPIRSVPNTDVKDVIEYIDDGYKGRRKIATRVLNGSEGWATSTPTKSGLYRYDVYVSDTSKKAYSAMCSHFVMSKATSSFADNVKEVSFAIHPNGNFCFFTEFATVGEFKTWLASNPITIQYEMAEEVIEDIADQTPFYSIPTYDGGTTISTTDRLQPQIKVEYPTNSVSGIASKAYAKSSIMSDKILSYQFRDLEGSDIGAYFAIELPVGVDGRNCTVLVSSAATSVKYDELGGTGEVWQFSCNSDVVDITSYILSDDGAIPTISGYIKYAKEGMYGHANVTVIRNDI